MFELHKLLYHYTTTSTAILKILPSMTLRMGTFRDLNDPREAKTWPFNIYSKNNSSNSLFRPSLFSDISSYVTGTSLVLCCTRDDPSVTDNDVDRDLRSGYGHPRMWAQYADKHHGVCLVLDMAKLGEEIIKQHAGRAIYKGPVCYISSTSGPNPVGGRRAYDLTYLEDLLGRTYKTYIDSHISKYNGDLFFTKHSDWKDEWEYRWVMRTEDGRPAFISIHNCLKAVILGAECNHDDCATVLDICKSLNIETYKAFWHGWAVSLFQYDPAAGPAISLNGITFDTKIPCGGVFVQGSDESGNVKPILIDNSGHVIPIT